MLCTALVKNLEAELHKYTNKLQNCNNSMKIPIYFQMQHFGSKYLRFVKKCKYYPSTTYQPSPTITSM